MSQWKTKDGQVLDIKDMTDRHLINTIKMLRRKTEDYKYAVIEQELAMLSVHDIHDAYIESFCFEDMHNTIENLNDHDFMMKYHPKYKAMKEELDGRYEHGLMTEDNLELYYELVASPL